MKLPFANKSLSPEATKYLDRKIADSPLNISHEEANAIGYAVAVAAEAASRTPWIEHFKTVGAPTEAEVAAEAHARAQWEAARALTRTAREECIYLDKLLAEARAETGYNSGYNYDHEAVAARDRKVSELLPKVRAATSDYDRAAEHEQRVSRDLQRAVAATMQGGAARQRAFAAGGF